MRVACGLAEPAHSAIARSLPRMLRPSCMPPSTRSCPCVLSGPWLPALPSGALPMWCCCCGGGEFTRAPPSLQGVACVPRLANRRRRRGERQGAPPARGKGTTAGRLVPSSEGRRGELRGSGLPLVGGHQCKELSELQLRPVQGKGRGGASGGETVHEATRPPTGLPSHSKEQAARGRQHAAQRAARSRQHAPPARRAPRRG